MYIYVGRLANVATHTTKEGKPANTLALLLNARGPVK